jgi:arginase family enzyme
VSLHQDERKGDTDKVGYSIGWTSRELRRILHSLVGLNIVGFDIVELSPAYDSAGEFVGTMGEVIDVWLNDNVIVYR